MMPNRQPDPIDLDYIASVSPPVHGVLEAIEAAAAAAGRPILDRDTGRLLSVLAFGRRRILEIGTGHGYSGLWLALGQGDRGSLVTIDSDAGRTALARERWREAGIADERVLAVARPALEALGDDAEPSVGGPFDLVFLDGPKAELPATLEAIVPRLARGALVVAAGVLEAGRVAPYDPAPPDSAAAGVRTFNAAMLCDARFSAAIVPLGGGLLVAAFRL